jgi:2-C-methyl-D-erythritol 4-phosphate cytidylyltransferase
MLIAGGSGQRMKQDIPKQFINVNDRPVIVYTLEAFQKHPNIDAIAVVCLEGWEEILKAYANQFNITKLKWVFHGGENGQASLRNGIMELAKVAKGKDMVLIHDAIRPMVSQEIISDNISCCMQHGSAITVIPCAEAMLLTSDKESSSESVPREQLARTQTPQAFYLDKLVWAHEEAEKRGINNSIATCTLMIELGKEVYFSTGSEKNLKLTTTDDIEIFKALLHSKKDEWMK